MHLLCSSFFPVVCFDDFFMTEFCERSFVGGCTEDNITSITSITSIGSSFWDILFASPRDDTIPAFSCLEGQMHFIDKHHTWNYNIEKRVQEYSSFLKIYKKTQEKQKIDKEKLAKSKISIQSEYPILYPRSLILSFCIWQKENVHSK